jgi:hypothetical protein
MAAGDSTAGKAAGSANEGDEPIEEIAAAGCLFLDITVNVLCRTIAPIPGCRSMSLTGIRLFAERWRLCRAVFFWAFGKEGFAESQIKNTRQSLCTR